MSDELPGMWEPADLSGGRADVEDGLDGQRDWRDLGVTQSPVVHFEPPTGEIPGFRQRPLDFTWTITWDVRPMAEAFVRIMRQMADALARFTEARDPALVLARRRAELGGNGSDAARNPVEWVSVACGAWLCVGEPAACPQPGVTLCTHGCHEGITP